MGCRRRGEQRRTGKKEKGGHDEKKAASQEAALNGRIVYWLQDGDEDDPPPLPPAAIAIAMTAAVPRAIHPIVPEDRPVAVFVPAASPALAASLVPAGGGGGAGGCMPGSAVFFGHVSHVSAATARETDPMLMTRKQAAQRIAMAQFTVGRRRIPRMPIPPFFKRRIIWVHDTSISGPCQGAHPRCGRSSRRGAGTGRCPPRRRASTAIR